jgi:hypothetical protein
MMRSLRASARFLQQLHDLLVRSAVQPALERADGGDDARMQVRLGRANDAGRERRGVEFMLGVENQRHIEGASISGARLLAAQHVQEVGGVAEIRTRRNRRLSLAETIMHGDSHRNLPQQPLGLAKTSRARRVFRIGIEVGQDADRTAKNIHRGCAWRNCSQQVNQRTRQATGRGDALLEIRELLHGWKVAVQQ